MMLFVLKVKITKGDKTINLAYRKWALGTTYV